MNLQFEIADEEIAKLEILMKDAGIETHRELFNNALTLFTWAVNQAKTGNVVSSIDEAGQNYTAVQMDSLNYAAEAVKNETVTEVLTNSATA